MKKILLVALVAAAMVSCSQNEEIDNAAQKAEIKFGTVVSSTTRAAVMNNSGLQDAGFKVYAYNTSTYSAGATEATLGNAFMPETAVTYDKTNSIWKYTGGPYYWPLTDKIQFFAYINDANAANYVATGLYPTIDYTVATTAAAQKDFVVAKLIDQTKPVVSSSAVNLKFEHALTQVNFSAIGKNTTSLYYKVKSVGLEGIMNKGTCNFQDLSWNTTGSTATEYVYPITSGGVSVSGATAVDLMTVDGSLMLVPQTMTASSKIKISYEVYSDAQMTKQIDEVKDSKIDLIGTTAWEAGKKIRYTLTLTAAGANVSFTTEVGNWKTESDIPLNETEVTE